MAIDVEAVSYSAGRRRLDGYLACPEGEGPFPALVVIHSIRGLSRNIKDVSRRLAGEGYVTLAVDLFTGRNRAICMFRFMGGLLLNSLHNSGVNDLKASLTYLAGRPGVDSERLGAIGFCMGGGFAIAWACTDDRLKVIAPFYGTNPRPLSAVARSCPVVGSYPGADFTAPQARKLAHELRKYGVPHDIKIYPGAKHAFFDDQLPVYDPTASEDAWRRTADYFRKKLA